MAFDSFLLSTADLAQVGITLLNFSAYPTQWKQMISRKSTADISLTSWTLWLGACILGQFYAWANYLSHGHNFALIITDTISLICVVSTITLIWYYRPKAKETTQQQRSIIDEVAFSEIIHDDFKSEISHMSFEYEESTETDVAESRISHREIDVPSVMQ
jgi:hypothetical protein